MRQDKHCCYQNDRNIVLIPFCLQLLPWSLWASQINSVIHPGIPPAPKNIPSKTVEKALSALFPNLWASAPQKTSEPAWKRWLLYFPSACLSGGTSNQILAHLNLWNFCSANAPPTFWCLSNLLLHSPKPFHLSSFQDPSQLTLMLPQFHFWLPVSFTAPRFQLTWEVAFGHDVQLKFSPNSLAKTILLLWTLWFYCCSVPWVLVISNFCSALSPQKPKGECKCSFKHWSRNCWDKYQHNTAYQKKASELISGCW